MITMETFIKLIKKFLGYFLLLIIIICVLMYWRASKYLDNKLNILDIIVNIIKDISANAIPSTIVAVISIYFFKILEDFLGKRQSDILAQNIADKVAKELDSRLTNNCHIENQFKNVDWDYYFSNSQKIIISTHYLDSWISTHEDRIKNFFQANGELEIILPDTEGKKIKPSI